MGSKSKLRIWIFYLKDNLRSKLIQLILTFMNKRWEFPRETSPLLHCFKWHSFAKVLNDNIEDSLYVVGFLICYRGKNVNIIERQWQECINKIEKWAMRNGFNSKTVGMHFCNELGPRAHPALKLYNSPIKIVSVATFVGLLFDSKLTFLPHIKTLQNKCLWELNMFKCVSCINWGADQSYIKLLDLKQRSRHCKTSVSNLVCTMQSNLRLILLIMFMPVFLILYMNMFTIKNPIQFHILNSNHT